MHLFVAAILNSAFQKMIAIILCILLKNVKRDICVIVKNTFFTVVIFFVASQHNAQYAVKIAEQSTKLCARNYIH
jgi:hypothetical protein